MRARPVELSHYRDCNFLASRGAAEGQVGNWLREWEFDIAVNSWIETLSPGNEQRDYWGSRAARMPGSQNIIGTKRPFGAFESLGNLSQD